MGALTLIAAEVVSVSRRLGAVPRALPSTLTQGALVLPSSCSSCSHHRRVADPELLAELFAEDAGCLLLMVQRIQRKGHGRFLTGAPVGAWIPHCA